MPEVKKGSAKRGNRFTICINDEYDNKLKKLAVSCDLSKSELSDKFLRMCLDSPELIAKFQDTYNKDIQYKVHPVIINNRVHY